tara:strand:- start:15008 stop:15367 length:360 start_codon:yes stop_codon:yes gene_type:complete
MARLKPSDEKKLRALADIDPRIAAELKRHDQLTNQLSDFLAQQKAENRKARNRELIIIGSCVFAESVNSKNFKDGLRKLLDRHAARNTDRKFLASRGWEITEYENTENTNSTPPISATE